MQNPIVISVEGNIGAGKSTLLEQLRVTMPDAEIIVEPVGEWMRLMNAEGKSLLELFYEDKRRWAYSFQNCALLTRLRSLAQAIRGTKKQIIITERSVLTDRHVFAEMLRASGDIDDLEWQLYLSWYDMFATAMPLTGIVYLTTDATTSAERITMRRRQGEGAIPPAYLADLEAQHEKWLTATTVPVLRVATDETAVQKIRKFAHGFL